MSSEFRSLRDSHVAAISESSQDMVREILQSETSGEPAEHVKTKEFKASVLLCNSLLPQE